MDLEDVVAELRKRIELARVALDSPATAAPGNWRANYRLGYHDALGELLEWIEDGGK